MPFKALNIRPEKIVALTEYLIQKGVGYKLGSKIPLKSLVAPDGKVDCSGFVRWVIFRATAERGVPIVWPDGSYMQHAFVKAEGFKVSSFEAGKLKDGAVRIAFLEPDWEKKKPGHVALIVDGKTCESYSPKGVGRRVWGSAAWMKRAKVYVLKAPSGA